MTSQHITITAFANKLTALKQVRFSGRLLLKGPLGQEWTFYCYMGRIVYATGGIHPVRRWQRNLAAHCFNAGLHKLDQLKSMTDTSGLSADAVNTCWEYSLLCLWLQQQRITRDQVVRMIQSIILEVLFDVTQALHVTFQIQQEHPLSPQLVLIDAEQGVAEAQKIWNIWKTAKISDVFPDRAPLIKQPELLQQKTSATAYKSLTLLFDGQRSLRDISVQTKRNVTEVTRSLLPYIEAGLVELINIPDLPVPIGPTHQEKAPIQAAPKSPLIACVDDSPLVCQTMEKILTAVGYQFLAVQDSMRAIATLLSRKPELIFLDLVMPNTNGYEICTQLRKVSAFRETPIIILTGNDGIIDRVRAKVVGATDFLSKPVDAETVLAVANKYLKHLKNSSIVIG
ncbi:MAG: response regulator [Aphanothece sp. CMT-3BRIN-NPC111]|nr:response regulator [Aphanothece sp. CMT-3BRIN-NPC111]